ncbi:vitamin D 25-hydroxylase [Trichonephila clavipes]|nr:vitamin D 25-hydroxylase [Trichonephila clavipes]
MVRDLVSTADARAHTKYIETFFIPLYKLQKSSRKISGLCIRKKLLLLSRLFGGWSQGVTVTTLYRDTLFEIEREETTIEGYRIPRRSIIRANLWSINFDPESFPNPEVFNPRRFLDEKGKRIKKDGPYPFTVGKRSCVGEALGQMEVFLFISSLIQNFHVPYADKAENLRVIPRK